MTLLAALVDLGVDSLTAALDQTCVMATPRVGHARDYTASALANPKLPINSAIIVAAHGRQRHCSISTATDLAGMRSTPEFGCAS